MNGEAELEPTEHGLVPGGDGWFVLNAKDAVWRHVAGRSAECVFEGATSRFRQLGINLNHLAPGEAMAMYHWEADQEDFLVLSGDAMLIIEGGERRLRQWDLVHCPSGTRHTIVGAGDTGACVLAVGARSEPAAEIPGAYTVDEVAIRAGVGVTEETADPRRAYAGLPRRRPTRFRPGWLPE